MGFRDWSTSKKIWAALAVVGVIALLIAVVSANQCGASVVGGP